MIGFLFREVSGVFGLLSFILIPCIAAAAICGCRRCRCSLRSCLCCKWLLRKLGVDNFQDFDLMVLVQQVNFTSSGEIKAYIKITAGRFTAKTETWSGKSSIKYQQAISVFVEQGTENVKFELCSTSNKTLATLKLSVMKSLLKMGEDGCPHPLKVMDRTFDMTEIKQGLRQTKLLLTFSPAAGDEEQALLSGFNASDETNFMLQKQVQQMVAEEGTAPTEVEQISKLQLLLRSCSGPLQKFGTLGSLSTVYVAVVGPPQQKKYTLQVWSSRQAFDKGQEKPKEEIELRRIASVVADPGRGDIFSITYVGDSKSKKTSIFVRSDRSREVWVEMLQALITEVHKEHAEQKKAKPKGQ